MGDTNFVKRIENVDLNCVWLLTVNVFRVQEIEGCVLKLGENVLWKRQDLF